MKSAAIILCFVVVIKNTLNETEEVKGVSDKKWQYLFYTINKMILAVDRLDSEVER